MKIWAMACRATQDMVKVFWQNVIYRRGKWQPTSVILLQEPHGQYERQKDRRWKMTSPPPTARRSEGVQHASGEEWRAITNISSKNGVAGPKQKRRSVVDMSGGKSKARYCKQQYCIGTWNFRSMNQGKLSVVKQEMERVNTHILGTSELKWWSVVIVRIQFTK